MNPKEGRDIIIYGRPSSCFDPRDKRLKDKITGLLSANSGAFRIL